jgi:hypothetical protein
MGSFVWLAFRALPWFAQAGAVVAILAGLGTGYGIWHHKVYMKGYRAHETLIIKNDARAVGSALKKRATRNDCLARGLRWEVTTGKCG